MAFYRIPLQAGVEHVQYIAGSLILVDGIVGAAGVDVTPILNNSPQVTMPGRKAGFKYRTNFDGVALRADVDCEVRIFLTTNDVSLGFTDGAQVNVFGSVQVTNGADARLPVDIAGGTVNLTAENITVANDAAHAVPVALAPAAALKVNNADADSMPMRVLNTDATAVPVRYQALATIVDKPVVNVGTIAASIVNDNTLKRLRIRNGHASALVALGGAGVTLAAAAIILKPGDVYMEEDAAGANWYAISDTANTTVQIQGIK